MSEDMFYELADELADQLDDALDNAVRLRELSLMKRGPLTDGEKTEARARARDICNILKEAAESSANLKDATDW